MAKVIYNGNGNTTGSVPVDGNTYNAGDTVTVLGNTGGLGKSSDRVSAQHGIRHSGKKQIRSSAAHQSEAETMLQDPSKN